jgi:group I intron endonuclease
MFIYETTNLVNGMKYIGQSTRKETEYYLGSGNEIKKAVKEFGRKNFSRTILERCQGIMELTLAEIKWIEKLNAVKSLKYYNISPGGSYNSNFGKSRTDEVKKKISKTNKGFQHTEEAKEKIRQAATGRKLSEKTKQKLSNFRTGTKQSEETKKKISQSITGENNPFYGKTHSEKTKQILREKSTKQHQLNPRPKGENNKESKSIICIHPNGAEETFIGIKDMCRKLGLRYQSVGMVLKGEYSHHKRYKFKLP